MECTVCMILTMLSKSIMIPISQSKMLEAAFCPGVFPWSCYIASASTLQTGNGLGVRRLQRDGPICVSIASEGRKGFIGDVCRPIV